MKKLLTILEQHGILTTRRTKEERTKNHIIATQRLIQQYIKNGSKGDLNLDGAPITSLPPNLTYVQYDLDLLNTRITSLPDNFSVGQHLYLYDTPITSLPDNLKVGGGLYGSGTQITSLPNNLKVGGDLTLAYTPITSLPDNLNVNGNLDLVNTPISKKYTAAQLKQLLPGVRVKYLHEILN
jgi:hypothetical protein